MDLENFNSFFVQSKRPATDDIIENDVEGQFRTTVEQPARADFHWNAQHSHIQSLSERVGEILGIGRQIDPPDLPEDKSEDSFDRKSDTSGTASETSDSSSSRGRSPSRRPSSKRNRRKRLAHNRSPSQDKSAFATSQPQRHIELFAHGRFLTILAISLSWIGFALSCIARNSTEFVEVESPIYIDANFNEVYEVGLTQFQLCFNASHTGFSGCQLEALDADDVDDRKFQVSRSVAFLAILFGGFLSVVTTATIYWQSVNLRPVGFAFLMVYFMQSFTFLFYDSNLCARYGCNVGAGTIQSIISSICWFLSCLAVARMDAHKHRQQQLVKLQRGLAGARSRSRSPKKRFQNLVSREILDGNKQTDMNEPGHKTPPITQFTIEASDPDIENVQSRRRNKENETSGVPSTPSKKRDHKKHGTKSGKKSKSSKTKGSSKDSAKVDEGPRPEQARKSRPPSQPRKNSETKKSKKNSKHEGKKGSKSKSSQPTKKASASRKTTVERLHRHFDIPTPPALERVPSGIKYEL